VTDIDYLRETAHQEPVRSNIFTQRAITYRIRNFLKQITRKQKHFCIGY